MAFKIAYGAGHYRQTPGKRLPKELDETETREWVLNSRVAEAFAQAAKAYDVELLRLDDATGQQDVSLAQRCRAANNWGADMYLSIHHNAGAKLTQAGGIVAFSYPGSKEGAAFRNGIYDACIAAGGLKGNRANPKTTANFQELRESAMPAVLMEYGFMDSRIDAPIILQETYSATVGKATMVGIAQVAGIPLKQRKDDLEVFVKEIQKAFGAKVDGIAGPETLQKTKTLSQDKNNTHVAVKAVQQRLWELGYTQVGEADGIAGVKFTAAVKAFQKDNGCWVDGEITARNKTWRKLLKME